MIHDDWGIWDFVVEVHVVDGRTRRARTDLDVWYYRYDGSDHLEGDCLFGSSRVVHWQDLLVGDVGLDVDGGDVAGGRRIVGVLLCAWKVKHPRDGTIGEDTTNNLRVRRLKRTFSLEIKVLCTRDLNVLGFALVNAKMEKIGRTYHDRVLSKRQDFGECG